MEGSVCSCDTDTMQDELYTTVLAPLIQTDKYFFFFFVRVKPNKLHLLFKSLISIRRKAHSSYYLSAEWMSALCTLVWTACLGIWCYSVPVVTVMFLLAHLCLSTCLFNYTELLLTGFLSKPVYL